MKPSAWPISCVATASKSICPKLMPLLRSKSKLNEELNPIRAALSVVWAVGLSRPMARAIELETETVLAVPLSVGSEPEGNAL